MTADNRPTVYPVNYDMVRPHQYLIQTATSYLVVIPLWAQAFLSADEVQSYWQLPLYHRPPIVVYGKTYAQNRDVGFFSDTSAGYQYSGQTMTRQPLTSTTAALMSTVNAYLGTAFNGILVNCYRDGSDKLSAHSDAEDALDRNLRCVAGLSFGAVRTFRVRYKSATVPEGLVVDSSVDCRKYGSTIIADIPCEEGMLLVMGGNFQSEFTHEIPSVSVNKVSAPRLSLTFRQHLM